MAKSSVKDILNKCLDGGIPTREEALILVQVDLNSEDFYHLSYVANKLSREHFGNKGDVVAQIGIDYAPCSSNCGFCAFGSCAGVVRERLEWDAGTVVKTALAMVEAGANGVYLMTTADYPFKKLIDIAAAVRAAMPEDIPLIANTGDFNFKQAQELKEAGFSAVYHALRLREGVDTGIPQKRRLETVASARKAGLAVQVCLEPVGPEHRPEEMVEQMFWAREIGAAFNGAMKRMAVPGTRLADLGEISYRELARLVAVARLVMGDRVAAHCTHEPNLPALIAGANLIWAEAGPNPRDVLPDTAAGRGQSVKRCREMLFEAGYEPRQGATPSAYPIA